MLSLNPHAKVLEEIFIPRGRSFYKEECLCTPGQPHWAIVYQERLGKEIINETTIVQTPNEKLADYVMNIVKDNLLLDDIPYDL